MATIEDERIIVALRSPQAQRETRVLILKKDGRVKFSLHNWFARNGVMVPGKFAFLVPIEALPDLADGIALALEKARAWGLCK